MKRVLVTAATAATALGDLEATFKALKEGRIGIAEVKRFPTDKYVSKVAGCISALDDEHQPSRFSALLSVALQGLGPVPPEARLFTATTKAGVDALEGSLKGRGDNLVDALPQSMEYDVRRRLGITRPGSLISAACASSTIALTRAVMSIIQGATDVAVVVCADVVTEFVFSGFSSLRALSAEPCRPFDRNRRGLSLGEGGAALLLMSEDRARREGRAILGEIAGFGVAGDAVHITAPARDGCGLIAAVKLALGRAGISPEDIGAVSAHGTGTVYNDLMELTAFRAVFGHRVLPIHSVKGALGHTMGAAGGIEAALGLLSLQAKVIPGTMGCQTPESLAEGWLSNEPQPLWGEYLLTTNSGFGGINAALVLKRQSES